MNDLAAFRRVLGALLATLLGVAFFFTIIGVFGLRASIFALLIFIAAALVIFRRPQHPGGAA